jgi:hypothetical protein
LAGAENVLDEAALAELHSERPGSAPRDYSHGWGRIPLGGDEVAFISDGQALGSSALILLLPKHGLAVTLVTNANVDLLETAMQICDGLEPGLRTSLTRSFERAAAGWKAPGRLPEGVFSGSADLPGKRLPIRIDFGAKPGPVVTLGDAGARLMTSLEWNRGLLEATVPADLPLPTNEGRSHELDLVFHIGPALDGFATDALEDDAHHRHFGVPYALHLERAGKP